MEESAPIIKKMIDDLIDEIVDTLHNLPDCEAKRDLSRRLNTLEENLMALD